MTAYTRVITKDGDADVAVRKVEDGEEVEDVDMATRIWEGKLLPHA